MNVVKETRNETYRRLAKLAGEVGVEEGKVYGLLEVGDQPGEGGSLNIGNGVTDDLKVMVKVRAVRFFEMEGLGGGKRVEFDGL